MRALAVCLLLAAGPGAAGQPYSESLLDCAAIMQTMDDNLSDGALGQNAERRARLQDYAERLFAGAVEQARAEGIADPFTHASGLMQAKSAHWQDKGVFWLMSEEGRDWTTYCRKFSRHMGIAPPRL